MQIIIAAVIIYAIACDCQYLTKLPNHLDQNLFDNDVIKLGKKNYIFKHLPEWKYKWFQAEQYCRSRNSTLICIESAEEMQLIADYFDTNNITNAVYTGANDEILEGQFICFKTGEPIIYSKWAKDRPRKSYNEQCTMLKLHNSAWEFWDCRCNTPGAFICELLHWNTNCN